MNSTKSILSILSLFCVLFFSANLQAQATPEKGAVGIGVMIGEPTGVSLKFWNSSSRAYDLGVAWSFSGNDAISLHGDYLWHKWLDSEKGELAFHYGLGARALVTENNSAAGLRVPVGISYLIQDTPIELFVEVAPVINVLPDTDADGVGGLGARFYF
jgi:hypothetical protein